MGKDSRIDVIGGTLIIMAMLCLSAFTVFIGQDERLSVLATISMALLAIGIAGGEIIHDYRFENKINPETFLYGFFGISLVALIQIPVMISGISIYGLSALDFKASRLFLIAQAVSEEAFFANVVYAFLKRTSIPQVANVATASIFMIFHSVVYANQTLVLFVVFLSRLALNFIYDRGGLGSSMMTHVIVNAFAG